MYSIRYDCRFSAGSARRQVVIFILALGVLSGCSEPQNAEPAEQYDAGSPLRTRLLTADQYTASIAQVFGEDIADSILPPIPPMARTDGLLASGSAFVGVTSDQVSQIQQTAASIAAQVVDQEHRDFLIPCMPEATEAADSSCAALFLEETGRLLFRRPLSDSRLSDLVQIADYAAQQTGDFYDGLSLALEAMLISPDFIFIADRAEADPDAPGQQRLDAYSLASRLSFLLWNAPPDDVLLEEAEAGLLHTPQGLAGAVDRMLGSARLESGVRAFFDDLMAFDEFNSLAKDPLVYPMVTGTTLEHAREQTLRTIVDHLLTRQADYRDLFTTRKTFMSMQLAAVYDTPAGEGWVPFEFEEEGPRLGLLTHVSFLAANSHSVPELADSQGQSAA